jgi:hypothetical protein
MTDQLELAWLAHYFQNANIANVGDATGLLASSTVGNVYISLHTSDPGETGVQNTNETSYTNYLRIAVPRNVTNWTTSGTSPTQVANALAITFAQCGASGATLTHFGIGSALSGTGNLHFSGALTSSLAVSNGVTPSFAIGAAVVTQD